MKITSLCFLAVTGFIVACSSSNSPGFGVPFDHNYVGCTNDVDCTNNGTACGTDVCSWADAAVHVCVAPDAGQGDWCGDPNLPAGMESDQTCKCYEAGATCNTITNYCSFTLPQ
jgi:hypothetical protein